jgi:hypothetical protein
MFCAIIICILCLCLILTVALSGLSNSQLNLWPNSLSNPLSNSPSTPQLNKNNFIQGGRSNTNDPSGWQLYLSTTCGHCKLQKDRLNGFNTYAEYENKKLITNNIKGKLYPVEKITAFPFWYNSKTKEIKLGNYDLCIFRPKIKYCKKK